jgi:hypothetical protein
MFTQDRIRFDFDPWFEDETAFMSARMRQR